MFLSGFQRLQLGANDLGTDFQRRPANVIVATRVGLAYLRARFIR